METVEPLALALAMVGVLYKIVNIIKPFILQVADRIKLHDDAYRAVVQLVAVVVGMVLMLFEAGAIGAFSTLLPAATPDWMIVVFGGVILSFGGEAVNFVFSLRDYLGNYELVLESESAEESRSMISSEPGRATTPTTS